MHLTYCKLLHLCFPVYLSRKFRKNFRTCSEGHFHSSVMVFSHKQICSITTITIYGSDERCNDDFDNKDRVGADDDNVVGYCNKIGW